MMNAEAMRAYLIAEVGVNHNGDPEMALALIDAAAEAGADAIKFQIFNPEALASKLASKAPYQKNTTDAEESQLDMLRRLTLDLSEYRRLIERCKHNNVNFLATPFDLESLEFLIQGLGQKLIKIGSGDLTNAPLLLKVARSGCKVILSTGMATLNDIQMALSILAFGYSEPESSMPGMQNFGRAFNSSSGRDRLAANVTLLHCTTAYPVPFEEVNLHAMNTLAETFRLTVGFSDHTVGIEAAIAAVARGASVIEKHITLDRRIQGPDHSASIEPNKFHEMVQAIRNVEQALGDGEKILTRTEHQNIEAARKSLVAAREIRKGEKFCPQNLTVKRPGGGISPSEYWDWIG
ncbi:MAG: N-acetylneuraminate synthase, partial [Rhodospirillales bacterium]